MDERVTDGIDEDTLNRAFKSYNWPLPDELSAGEYCKIKIEEFDIDKNGSL